jgi:GH35 family endo-1,4-beta-xylanase
MAHFAVPVLMTFAAVTLSTQTRAGEPTLRELADKKGVTLGAAVMSDQLDDSDFTRLLVEDCNYLTPENELKWSIVHPQKDLYDFSGGDKILAFAQEHGMKMRGHTLAWHNQNPSWLADAFRSKEQFLGILEQHIKAVVGHYKGKIRDWDVVNEAIDDNGTLRDNLWHYATGPEYIEHALTWAHEADPDARLFINDYGVEEKNSKSDKLYELLKELKEKGLPLNGVGFQFHVDGQYIPDWVSVAQNVKRFQDLGLEVQVTEMDVRLTLPSDESSLSRQARIYAEALRMAESRPVGKTFIIWGLWDKHSWIPSTYAGSGEALIRDDQGKPKPAHQALYDVLAKDDTGSPGFDRYLRQENAPSRPGPTFHAVRATAAPTLDGVVAPGEWSGAVAYPYLYNQLDDRDRRPPGPQKDLWGRWRVMYVGDTLYGLVERKDDLTNDSSANAWDNDCVELFFSVDGQWKQYRTVVGHDWQEENQVPGKAVWSKDGSVLEFSVQLPKDVTGLTIGWNTALADNDTPGGSARKCQLYPVVGNNTGWQGRGFAELTFANAQGEFVDGPVVSSPPPFAAVHVEPDKAPKIDGKDGEPIWKSAPIYPLGYDLLSATDQSQPDEGDLSGDWRLLASGKTLYGLLHRKDDKTVTGAKDPRQNDHVEIDLSVGGKLVSLVTVVGKGFTGSGGAKKAKAVWSKDGTVLEFAIELPAELPSELLWSIGLFDNDGGPKAAPKHALFPFAGYERSRKGSAPGVGPAKASEFGKLQLQ